MLDFGFANRDEIGRELGERLRAHRMAQGLLQAELAERAGVSAGTVKNLETKGQATLGTVIRIVMALDLADQLAHLFKLQVNSIARMEQAESSKRVRASRRRRP